MVLRCEVHQHLLTLEALVMTQSRQMLRD